MSPREMTRRAKTSRCPVCDQPIVNSPCLPFCGAHCRNVDLGRWFNEGYSVPVETRRLAEQLLEEARDGIDDEEELG